jgi:pyruvate,orthophosphate dikinase
VFIGDLPTIPSEIVRVTSGALPAAHAPMYQSFSNVLAWADDVRRLKVRANADTPKDAR